MNRELHMCQHCGAPGKEQSGGKQVYVECTNVAGYTDDKGVWHESCGVRTPGFEASLDYGARDRVADIWNLSASGGKGSKGDPFDVPQAEYQQGLYYREESGKLYLCFKYYKGVRLPSELIDHNFALVAE